MRTVLGLVVLLTLFSRGAFADAGLTGVVRFLGEAPPKTVINKGAPAACGTEPVYDESLVTSGGNLANVVITVDGAPKARLAPKTLVLDQKGCRYLPHVQAAPVGSTLAITNSDAVLHTAHAYRGTTTLYNVATPTVGSEADKVLDAPGIVSFKCDAGHTWMAAFVVVTNTPYYAVTRADGTFAIADLPPGSYTVKAWHEKLGERTTNVTVAADKPAHLTIDYR